MHNKVHYNKVCQNHSSNLIPFTKDGITYIKIGNLIFASFVGVSSSVIIAEKYRPSRQRTITGLISFNDENNTYVVDCDIEPTGKTIFHYKDTVYSRKAVISNSFIFGTGFFLL